MVGIDRCRTWVTEGMVLILSIGLVIKPVCFDCFGVTLVTFVSY